DAIKERKEVWIPEKEGAWWLTPGLKPQLLCTYDSAAEVGNSFASQASAEAAVPLRYNQQILAAYKREFDPAFKPFIRKFDSTQFNAYPIYDIRAEKWLLKFDQYAKNPQITYTSSEVGAELVKKINNGTVVLELGT
ncbi:MAG: hypothetical protein GY817_04155, partial [bacterium]|nr:hypothetical protein [bacterium]